MQTGTSHAEGGGGQSVTESQPLDPPLPPVPAPPVDELLPPTLVLPSGTQVLVE
jgi:hypothetical protein